jgi:hypothetical protein
MNIKQKYPYLAKSKTSETIVYFIKPSYGLTIKSNSKLSSEGDICQWVEDCFEFYDGEIILKNSVDTH